jgi:hypothetical protein
MKIVDRRGHDVTKWLGSLEPTKRLTMKLAIKSAFTPLQRDRESQIEINKPILQFNATSDELSRVAKRAAGIAELISNRRDR